MGVDLRHGGNREALAAVIGCDPAAVLDASASLAPWTPRLSRLNPTALRDYPDRGQTRLRELLAALHGLSSTAVLPGNGAAELFTWAARDAAMAGVSGLLAPGFADYRRALSCWGGVWNEQALDLSWGSAVASSYPSVAADVLWICNPHNPTGQLWSRASLEPLLQQYSLVICDEAFLPLVPDGEVQSLIPLVAEHSNLVVVRSLTKLFGIAGVRLGYAVGLPERLQRWASWRDPWPVNGVAMALADQLLADPSRYRNWCRRVQRWTHREGTWMRDQLARLPGLHPLPSAANFLLMKGEESLVPLRETLERRDRILLRDCSSFTGLGDHWLRIGLQRRRDNRRIISGLRRALRLRPLI